MNKLVLALLLLLAIRILPIYAQEEFPSEESPIINPLPADPQEPQEFVTPEEQQELNEFIDENGQAQDPETTSLNT